MIAALAAAPLAAVAGREPEDKPTLDVPRADPNDPFYRYKRFSDGIEMTDTRAYSDDWQFRKMYFRYRDDQLGQLTISKMYDNNTMNERQIEILEHNTLAKLRAEIKRRKKLFDRERIKRLTNDHVKILNRRMWYP